MLVPTPTQTIAAGATASYVVLVAPRSTPTPTVTFVVIGLPDGAIATISPNPTSNSAELRVSVPAVLAAGTYVIRVVGNSGTTSKTATLTLVVLGVATTTVVATTTTSPPVAGQFALSVVADGKKLAAGGAVSFDITVLPGSGFTGQVGLAVAGVPQLVSAAFTTNPTTSKSTLWLSTTLSPQPGTYTLQLTATAIPNGQVFTLPLTLVVVS